MSVISNDCVEEVRALIVDGVDVNEPDSVGVTPLSMACQYCSVSVVQALLDAGAAVNLASKDFVTPLMRACESGDVLIVRALLAANANVHMTDQLGRSALWISCTIPDNSDVILSLIEAGAYVDHADKSGCSCLAIAVIYDNVEAVQCLLDRGACMQHTDKRGRGVLHVAISHHRIDLAKDLIMMGADVSCADQSGCTVLMQACKNSPFSLEIIPLLVQRGARWEDTDLAGRRAVDFITNSSLKSTLLRGSRRSDLRSVSLRGWLWPTRYF